MKKNEVNNETINLDGLVSGKDLIQAFKKNNVKYIYKTIVPQDIQPFLDEGWAKIGRGSKKSLRLRKLKDIPVGFEDEVWCIFYKMGFDEMNKDHDFSISRKGSTLTKQIDVFARDEQCICIIECKSAEKPHTKRSLDKDIDQIAGIRHDLELSIFSHYKNLGYENKFKLVWILALKNIDISENDQERANSANIRVMDESMIEYYLDLSNHFGRSSKYQFLSDMFPGRDIPDLIEPIPAIKGKMAKTDFYSFVIEPEKLLKIAYIAHRGKSNEESLRTYQRMAKKNRLEKIADYIRKKEGIFPTNIVINIQTDRPLRFEPASEMAGKNAILGTLYIPNKYKTAWIIDGQHRLFAYSNLEEAKTATLPVLAFENLEPNIQAKLFIDINGEQVKVSKNLLSDLWATIHWNSENPGEQLKALTSRLVKDLNENSDSPLRDRIINIEGRKTKLRNITPTALIEEIYKRNLIGSIGSRSAKVITPGPLFVDDLEKTLVNSRKIISGYLSNYINFNESLSKQWDVGSGEGGYICTNSGLIALLRILYAVLNHIEHVDHQDIQKMKPSEVIEEIWKYQKPVCQYLGTASPKIIQDFRSNYGEAGFRACTFELMGEINKVHKNFEPQGLQQWIQSKSNLNNPRAYEMISNIETEIMNHVTFRLKDEFGKDIEQWWHKGVPEKIRVPSMQRAQNAGEYRHPEKFVDLIDWQEIISHNLDLFGEIFTINAKQNDGKKKKLAWLVELNEIRKIVAHPPRGGISNSQLDYLTSVYDELIPRLKKGVE
ncbi:MAG: hypothetical protein MPEBLZ_01871 [Candidatus Methanoperedens nitroreducens]|uniref:DGQHR domain protein n=1 Tax=Candidatus Methanoperedens nitratireducens TaxID=1392998 RepID=A0A0P8E0I2_9EURY|nr:DGQHR domain-containing protein [Candidatus Methanoperedens sp. BLZ2]KAB2948391.1 MAG: DGQHR domain-containing protein [Candidatus Methanoperedens sp.]KPQ43684.1 MAG: hypothetical protein MPEBLZ_01871 [Candidatus Methanoperedens sp. BLZ1]MBZ0174522.1 DGQHR domain-containing protein [Candidatus Methanoperedens nitroreducens]MCX9078546.1 DGQHR domain-containing protein [Candidatus Methanoperedens sp.]